MVVVVSFQKIIISIFQKICNFFNFVYNWTFCFDIDLIQIEILQ